MRTEQRIWRAQDGWQPPRASLQEAQLVLAFGGVAAVGDPVLLRTVASAYPAAAILGCSTAGEIAGTHVQDDSLIVTAIHFDQARVQAAAIDLREVEDAEAAGERLMRGLPAKGLRHVLVLSDGIHVNGSALVAGMRRILAPEIQVTGGLAGDGGRFQATLTLAGAQARERRVAAIGLYGDTLRVGYGSLGGWDPFGPRRTITRSKGNVLYELDGRPALALYRQYLGEHAAGLPATGLLFPLSLQVGPNRTEVVRTILAVNEADQSLTFAGDVPQGATARLMKANFDRLVDGAQGAARTSSDAIGGRQAELALLISCVGRKLVLKQRVEEELEAVREVLGPQATLAGFYSYGEICPSAPQAACELHNQTMTITTLREELDAQAA